MANYFHVALRGHCSLVVDESSTGICRILGGVVRAILHQPLWVVHPTRNPRRLLAVQQCKGEMLWQYIQRFSQVRNTIPCISLAAVIMAFSEGVTNKRLVGKLETQMWKSSLSYSLWRTSTPKKPRRTPGSSIGALPRSLRRATAQNLAPWRTSGRLPVDDH